MHLTSPHTCHIPCPSHSDLVFLIFEIKIKPTSAYKHLRVSCIINAVNLHVHVLATQVAILREDHTKDILQKLKELMHKCKILSRRFT
jgi:hypothetical protein